MWNLSRLAVWIAVALAVPLAGCAAHHSTPTADDDQNLAEDGTDTSAVENDTETLSSSFIAAGGTLGLASAGELTGGTLAAANFGDAVRSIYVPAGCLTVTNDATAHTATYAFDKCSGPYGLLNVTGKVVVNYVSSATSLVLDFTGTDLQVNRATVNWAAHAEIVAGRLGQRTMTWRAQLTGTTARGRAFTRNNSMTIAWTVGGECVLVNGASDGDVSGRNLHTDVISYSRCKGQCPADGSEIRVTNTNNGRSIDLKYNGGTSATFTAPDGTQSPVTLTCGG